jgi:hypothetical protein
MSAEHPAASNSNKSPRVPLRGVADLLLADGLPIEVRSLDIGVDGMVIVAPINPLPGGNCAIRVTIPGNAIVEANARVSDCVLSHAAGGFVIHLLFIDLPREAAENIIHFVKLKRSGELVQ